MRTPAFNRILTTIMSYKKRNDVACFQMDYKLPPFFDCCLTFIGFSEEEKAHMEETTIEQGTG